MTYIGCELVGVMTLTLHFEAITPLSHTHLDVSLIAMICGIKESIFVRVDDCVLSQLDVRLSCSHIDINLGTNPQPIYTSSFTNQQCQQSRQSRSPLRIALVLSHKSSDISDWRLEHSLLS
jgi:hypothetical protein